MFISLLVHLTTARHAAEVTGLYCNRAKKRDRFPVGVCSAVEDGDQEVNLVLAESCGCGDAVVAVADGVAIADK